MASRPPKKLYQTTMGWSAQCAEWRAIAEELVSVWVKGGQDPRYTVTPYRVTLKQKERMLARGQRPMTGHEIIAELGHLPKMASPNPSPDLYTSPRPASDKPVEGGERYTFRPAPFWDSELYEKSKAKPPEGA